MQLYASQALFGFIAFETSRSLQTPPPRYAVDMQLKHFPVLFHTRSLLFMRNIIIIYYIV